MTRAAIREAGDSALHVELGAAIDSHLNARVIAVAAAVRAAAIAGVRDVVATYGSVAVYLDPLNADVDAVREVLERALGEPTVPDTGRDVTVPVVYGGEDGPDLADVAAFAGVEASDVVTEHAGATYRVFMLGFLPGFAYMGPVNERIAMPRRDTPRLRVPAGSVGIAGQQTGIYPVDSPGGWRIIGRTTLRMFDPERTPATLVAPGDRVRFMPVPVDAAAPPSGRLKAAPTYESRTVTVLRPGLLTTIQDLGRWGHQAIGVPVSGPMDALAHRTANAIVGNPDDAAALEATLLGPELRIDDDAIVALSGGDLDATLDGAEVPLNSPHTCRPGSVLRFGERRAGVRTVIAFDGGIASVSVLGSRATHVRSGLGGLDGRPLAAGDRLPLGPAAGAARRSVRRIAARPLPHGGAALRVLPGPQRAHFHDDALARLEDARFVIAPQSDRMGYRLSGGRLPRRDTGEMISDATFTGGIQVPPSGEPILLMADRQTTGGYPQIAVVISADLPVAGQLAPGDWVEFRRCSTDEARAALAAQEAEIRDLA